jgi:hypothetical protein
MPHFAVIYFRFIAFLCWALANVKKHTNVLRIPRVFCLLEDRVPSSATNIITWNINLLVSYLRKPTFHNFFESSWIPSRWKESYFLFWKSPERLWWPPGVISNEYRWVFSQRVERPEREVDQSYLFPGLGTSGHISSPPHAFTSCTRGNFTFTSKVDYHNLCVSVTMTSAKSEWHFSLLWCTFPCCTVHVGKGKGHSGTGHKGPEGE